MCGEMDGSKRELDIRLVISKQKPSLNCINLDFIVGVAKQVVIVILCVCYQNVNRNTDTLRYWSHAICFVINNSRI